MIKPAAEYLGQIIHCNGHDYTILGGPDYEHAPIVDCIEELGKLTVLFVKLGDDGAIAQVSTHGSVWHDVTITPGIRPWA